MMDMIDSCLFFPKDGGALLCVIDESSDHTISVWDWQKGEKGHKLAENKVSMRVKSSNRYRHHSTYSGENGVVSSEFSFTFV